MQQTLPTIVFFGNERLATGVSTTAPTLQALIDGGYHVAAVVSNYQRGNSRNPRELEIAEIAKAHEIPLLLPQKLSDITTQLADYDAAAGVLVAYGKIIPQVIIDIFPQGIINIHPSLLPLHRGPTPLESILLSGEQKSGVSIMQLATAMDAGPVFGQSELVLVGNESKQELADTMLDIGKTMLLELLPGILDGSIVALPQSDEHATYDTLLDKDSGVIDWHKPAVQLEREIRAFANWPKSRTQLAGKDIVITKAHAVASNNPEAKPGDIDIAGNTLMVECGQGYLCIEELQPAGKSSMPAAAFIAGHRERL